MKLSTEMRNRLQQLLLLGTKFRRPTLPSTALDNQKPAHTQVWLRPLFVVLPLASAPLFSSGTACPQCMDKQLGNHWDIFRSTLIAPFFTTSTWKRLWDRKLRGPLSVSLLKRWWSDLKLIWGWRKIATSLRIVGSVWFLKDGIKFGRRLKQSVLGRKKHKRFSHAASPILFLETCLHVLLSLYNSNFWYD